MLRLKKKKGRCGIPNPIFLGQGHRTLKPIQPVFSLQTWDELYPWAQNNSSAHILKLEHSEYLILTAFPLQQWLHDRFSM